MPKVDDAHLAARRRQILDAAAACFAREGFHRTSVQDIVRESGVSAGLVYRYFTGKEDMIAAIVAEWQERRVARLGADPIAGYLDVLRSVADPANREEQRLGVQVWAESIRSERIRTQAREGVDTPRRLAAEAGLPDALARVLISVWQGLLLQTLWDEDLDIESYVEVVEQLLEPVTRSLAAGRPEA
ncbi:helix-turn-helix domain-containing protein [Dactylosporangium sp. AC04546]|uniref:TetR/AcrR family transcriptional regulator n=1 Tax=Dactylosporangium sp. AC04546 TaxID=2862460 RepID=UPI001EDC94B6|nr:TetR/AcrR family transcriptional regulator [Dactylosporangium sp. AC04546]WVK86168.1 helix-turn-helix domain-containing protein [Dactylosporangium sp. AC04546]